MMSKKGVTATASTKGCCETKKDCCETKSCCESKGCCKHHGKAVLIVLVVLGLIAMGIVSLLRDRIVNPIMDQVTFTAEGRAFAKPDIAQVVLGVETPKKATAAEALKDNSTKINQVIAKIKAQGVADKDIKTTSFNLSPAYDYDSETGSSKISGYTVNQSVTVKIRNLDKIGTIIEQATSVGANQAGGINFTIDDQENIKAVARAEAVAKAKVRAREMSKLTGIKLGKLVNVYEDSYAPGPMYANDYAMKSESAMGMGGSVATPIVPDTQLGENEVKVNVTLVYRVK